jgi:hypothetical protein
MGVSYEGLRQRKGWNDGLEWLEDLDNWSRGYEGDLVLSEDNVKLGETTVELMLWQLPRRFKGFARSFSSCSLGLRLRKAIEVSFLSSFSYSLIFSLVRRNCADFLSESHYLYHYHYEAVCSSIIYIRKFILRYFFFHTHISSAKGTFTALQIRPQFDIRLRNGVYILSMPKLVEEVPSILRHGSNREYSVLEKLRRVGSCLKDI